MDGHFEIWTGGGRQLVALPGARCTVGSAPENDVVVDEPSVSRVHALVEQLGGTWFVEDLGSRNGTFVNNRRVPGRGVVRPGDEIRLGAARLVLRGLVTPSGSVTEIVDEPPVLTRRERDVLIVLCRPLLAGDPFTDPASIREIATALTVSDAAVKQHLTNLYGKFGIVEDDRRRVRLANAALSTGAVTLADLSMP